MISREVIEYIKDLFYFLLHTEGSARAPSLQNPYNTTKITVQHDRVQGSDDATAAYRESQQGTVVQLTTVWAVKTPWLSWHVMRQFTDSLMARDLLHSPLCTFIMDIRSRRASSVMLYAGIKTCQSHFNYVPYTFCCRPILDDASHSRNGQHRVDWATYSTVPWIQCV